MITKTYYLENTNKANKRINKIIDNFMCFVETKMIEMNYIEVEIKCRVEDIKTIEELISDLV